MLLKQILENVNIKKVVGSIDFDVLSLCMNTKELQKNCLFFCITGTQIDGHKFAYIAKQKGAKAIVCERVLEVDITQIVVEDTRKAMSLMAANFYGNPRKNFKLVGITGTNGKTTTTYYVRDILKQAGFKVGVIGTIGVLIDDEKFLPTLTTPDPIVLQKIFFEMAKKHVDYVVMEVSAHAIYLNKLFGVVFDVGALTNVTQDHLDFFETFDKYKDVKKSFLTSKFCKKAAVNSDDEIGQKIIQSEKVFSYGLNNPSDAFIFDYSFSFDGTKFGINLCDDVKVLRTKQIGKFNLYNALCAASICTLLGLKTEAIFAGLQNLQTVEGRLNVIDLGEKKTAILDYAHTPDGLRKILETVKEISFGNIVSLFGCGGNRDKLKRPVMGQISGEIADFTIITSDNPRFEEPQNIICDIEKGIKKVTRSYVCIEDRKKAIHYGLKMLKENDCLVVCGKGAENYVERNGVKSYYSDRETIVCEWNKIKEKQID